MVLIKRKNKFVFWFFIGVYAATKSEKIYLFEKKGENVNSARHRIRKKNNHLLCLADKTGKSGIIF